MLLLLLLLVSLLLSRQFEMRMLPYWGGQNCMHQWVISNSCCQLQVAVAAAAAIANANEFSCDHFNFQ